MSKLVELMIAGIEEGIKIAQNAHNLNAYKDGHTWITYCKRCGLEGDQLIGNYCTGKVEAITITNHSDKPLRITSQDLDNIVKNGVDKSSIDRYINGLFEI